MKNEESAYPELEHTVPELPTALWRGGCHSPRLCVHLRAQKSRTDCRPRAFQDNMHCCGNLKPSISLFPLDNENSKNSIPLCQIPDADKHFFLSSKKHLGSKAIAYFSDHKPTASRDLPMQPSSRLKAQNGPGAVLGQVH